MSESTPRPWARAEGLIGPTVTIFVAIVILAVGGIVYTTGAGDRVGAMVDAMAQLRTDVHEINRKIELLPGTDKRIVNLEHRSDEANARIVIIERDITADHATLENMKYGGKPSRP